LHFDADELRRLRSAYQVLGVPPSSAAAEIKREFRRLAKTWHPDKWPAGSPQQAKAADRMREINLAFEAIRHAPLRYHIEGHPRVAARAAARGREVRRESVPITDYTEYAVRFVMGTFFGLFLCVVLACRVSEMPVALWVAIPMATGLASAYFGNAFWSAVLESLWWW
jgi:curved DNA-binding protein CbpA